MAAGCQEKESCSKVLNFLERLDDRIRQSTHEDTHMYTASVTLSSSPQLTSLTLSSSLQLTSLTLSSSLQVTSVTFLFSSANVTRSCSSHSCGVGHCDSGQSVGTYYLLTPLWHWSLWQRLASVLSTPGGWVGVALTSRMCPSEKFHTSKVFKYAK